MIVPIRLKISFAFLLKSPRPILVDSGSPGEENRIVAALEKENIPLAEVALLLHTHGHADHCGSSAALKKLAGIPAAIHPADAGKMREGKNGPLKATRLMGAIIRPFVDVPYAPLEPDILVGEESSLGEYSLPARIVSTPGHTAGSISLLFEDGRAIVGDLLMGGYLGGLFAPGLPDYHYFAEDLRQVLGSIRKLLDLGVRQFLVAHGGPLDAGAVRRRFERDFEA